jgi:superfamily II DNA/RNA helicase
MEINEQRKMLNQFRAGATRIMITTDEFVGSKRMLERASLVVNWDLPLTTNGYALR